MQSLMDLLIPANFMPHGHCYMWTPKLLWLYVISDGLIAAAYFSIPIAIAYFVHKRKDLQFTWTFKMFSVFIFACGMTHLISILTIWEPAYWLDASMKGVTAVASVITAIMLWRLMPFALTITSVKDLEFRIEQLKTEISQRKRAELELEKLNDNLENIVEKRTLDLTTSNSELLIEVEQRKRVEKELSLERNQAQVTLESVGDGVITTDMKSNVVYLNPVAERMTGWKLDEAKGRPILEVFRILNETSRKLAPNPVDVVLEHGVTCGLANHTVVVSKKGEEFSIEDSAAPIIDLDGETIGVVLVFHDVSQARRMAEKMSYLAEHDSLTDLPNRLLLTDRTAQAITSAKRNSSNVAVLYIDIDDFKKVNDTLGHEVGDQLLKLLSAELKSCIREMDTISRQGGDEFVILVSDFNDVSVPANIAKKVLNKINSTYKVGMHETNVSASIGIALYPNDGDNPDELMSCADAAMYSAKKKGRNNYQFFTDQLSTKIKERVDLENKLLKAVDQNELILHYQPKVCLKTGKMIGAEALIRWRLSDGTMVQPATFIPIAENMGLIKTIGKWVLNQACTQNKDWQKAGLRPLPISINVSALEFNHSNYLQLVSEALLKTGLDAKWLELEVTESVAIDGDQQVIDDLFAMKEMGVSLSIDDFGTGYSSLSYLKRLPVNTIKIDKSFVRDVKVDANDAAIVTAIIKMSHSLNFKVIAEGVETKEQLQFLKQSDCDEIQGYYISEPINAKSFSELLKIQTKFDV